MKILFKVFRTFIYIFVSLLLFSFLLKFIKTTELNELFNNLANYKMTDWLQGKLPLIFLFIFGSICLIFFIRMVKHEKEVRKIFEILENELRIEEEKLSPIKINIGDKVKIKEFDPPRIGIIERITKKLLYVWEE